MNFLKELKIKFLDFFVQYNDSKIETNVQSTQMTEFIKNNNLKKTKELLDEDNFDIDNIFFSTRYTALALSASLSKNEMMKLFISYNANVNFQDNFGVTPLMQASSLGNLNGVEILLENKADLNLKDKNGMTALDYAKFYENDKIINFLTQHN